MDEEDTSAAEKPPVIFARFYGNLRIIQLGPGDHFPRYANFWVREREREREREKT